MRYDLAFFLCCCRSFLGSRHQQDEEDYYELLGIDHTATLDEIKKAYKRQSLQMHPDKLAQKGLTVTEELQAKFTKMKDAYETLSDSHKRETYDAVGERGLKWMEEPFSIDPQEVAHNFATSSVWDRSKIFFIFVGAALAVMILPILICYHVDRDAKFRKQNDADDAEKPTRHMWLVTLLPLWLWNAFLLFYHTRVILMGPIPRPDSVPEAEWVDPLPMKKRVMSMFRFLLLVLFQLLIALKLDEAVVCPWSYLFIPLGVWEGLILYKKLPMARMRIVTVQDLEAALGKPFAQFTQAERELIGSRYSVVPSATSPEFELANKLKTRARHDMIKSAFRIVFCIVLLYQLDSPERNQFNWWLVFLPFWIMMAAICWANYQSFAHVQKMAMEKDPTLFGYPPDDPFKQQQQAYGSMGHDEENPSANGKSSKPHKPLTEEEKDELKAQVMNSTGKLISKCCSQGFFLLVVLLFVGKIQGAGYSSFWIISPFLFVITMILCCLGFAIFGVTEVATDGVEFDTGGGGEYHPAPETSARPTTNAAYTAPTSNSTAVMAPGEGASGATPIVLGPPSTATVAIPMPAVPSPSVNAATAATPIVANTKPSESISSPDLLDAAATQALPTHMEQPKTPVADGELQDLD